MKVGLVLFLVFLGASLFAQNLTSHSPNEFSLKDRLQGPSITHLFGTDENGSDLFTKILFGARLSLKISVLVTAISVFVGLLIGSAAGFLSDKSVAEGVILRLVDMFQAFPGFLLALAITAFMGAGVNHLILALCATSWTSYARLANAEVKRIRARPFVEAARSLGASEVRIIFFHCWPNMVRVFSVSATFGLAGTVLSEAGLSFLGLGAPPTESSWGALLGAGRKYILQAPHLSLVPGAAIFLLVLSFNLIGEGLQNSYSHT